MFEGTRSGLMQFDGGPEAARSPAGKSMPVPR
jgi:hypothetical protein